MKYLYLLFFLAALVKGADAQKIELVNSGEVIKQSITLYDSARYKDALVVLNKVNRSDTNYVWSVYEKAVNCDADSQYTESIKYCKEALALTAQREYEPELYVTWGNALDNMGQPLKALEVFDQGIAKYPSYSLFYFNKGVAYMVLKRYAEAEAMFQKTLLVNPYMYSAHFQLGYVALQQGKIIPAMLSITGYLLVSPEGKYWQRSIQILDKIAKGHDEVMALKNARKGAPDETYAEVEDILLSKIALDKSYKPLSSIDDPISRQIQAVFEKLEYQKGSNDFWIQYYLPYYKQVFSQGKFEPFIFHSFSNVNLPIVKNYNTKNKKELGKFIDEAAVYFDLIRSTRELNFSKRDTVKEKFYFEDGRLIGKGTISADGKLITGPWRSFYGAGNKRAVGNYNAAGQKIGTWTYFFYSGKVRAKETYITGKIAGTQEYYFENGNLRSLENYANGNLEGLGTSYNYAGNTISAANYKQGKKDGVERLFYSNGTLREVNNYSNDLLNGLSTSYFKNGKVKSTTKYIAGKADGAYTASNETLGIATEGQYVKDAANGEWKYYYETGKVKEKRTYVNNNEEGLHAEYYENGQLAVTYTAKKDKLNGEVLYYYKDGKVLARYLFDNGVPKSVNYLSNTGQPLYNAEAKGGLTNYITYTFNGYKRSHANFNVKGELEGPDTLFFPSGKVEQINEYKAGVLNGLSLTYFLNGTKKSEIMMTDGKDNGYYIGHHENGTLSAEGWMQDGEKQGQWNYYDEKGRLTSRHYYLDDDIDGIKETFTPNGKKNLEELYHMGWLEKLTQYDTTEKVIAVDSFPKSTGKYKLLYANGKVETEGFYNKGEFEGLFKSYYFDGSVESIYYYKNGGLDSNYVSYRYGGKKNSEGVFNNGNKWGTWKFYGEDGKLSSTTNYINDELNGEKTFYFEGGAVDYIGTYKDDELNGIAKKYDPDGTLGYQVTFEDGNAIAYSYLGADGKLTAPMPIAYINGKIKSYFPNGKPSRECSYSDGLKNDKDILYYTNGQVREEDAPAYGMAQGITKEYYPNGKMKSIYNYVNDNSDGVCKEYYANGNLKREIVLDNGQNHGPTKYFDENGKLVKTMWYYYDKLISVK